MKLAAWARADGIHPQTAYRWFRRGTLPVPAQRLPSGTILVEVPGSGVPAPDRAAALYARVSAHDQRADLDRQVARLAGWAAGQGSGWPGWSPRSAPGSTAGGPSSPGCSPTRRPP